MLESDPEVETETGPEHCLKDIKLLSNYFNNNKSLKIQSDKNRYKNLLNRPLFEFVHAFSLN